MVIFQNLSRNGEMLKNVGENIKKFLQWSSFTLWILKIQYLTKVLPTFLPSLFIMVFNIDFNLFWEPESAMAVS